MEERSSFDSVDSAGNRYQPHPYHEQPYDAHYGSPYDPWQERGPRWGGGGYERGPPRGYAPQRAYHPYYDDFGRPSPQGFPPYSYVQQPTLEEKTILRKKFSWKHFPEVRFFY